MSKLKKRKWIALSERRPPPSSSVPPHIQSFPTYPENFIEICWQLLSYFENRQTNKQTDRQEKPYRPDQHQHLINWSFGNFQLVLKFSWKSVYNFSYFVNRQTNKQEKLYGTDQHQNLMGWSLDNFQLILKISWKFVHNFSSYFENRQTNKREKIYRTNQHQTLILLVLG